MIAIRYGVIVRKGPTMKFVADVQHDVTDPEDAKTLDFTTAPIEAEDAVEAARLVTAYAATRCYGAGASSAFFQPCPKQTFRAAIGSYRSQGGGAVIDGRTIYIHVHPVE